MIIEYLRGLFMICHNCGSTKRKIMTNIKGNKYVRCAKCGSRLDIDNIDDWRSKLK